MGEPEEIVYDTQSIMALAAVLIIHAYQVAGARIRLDNSLVLPLERTAAIRDAFPETAPLDEDLIRLRFALWETLRGAIHSLHAFADRTEFAAYTARLADEQEARGFWNSGGI